MREAAQLIGERTASEMATMSGKALATNGATGSPQSPGFLTAFRRQRV
jgi:hypothetical protein